MSNNIPWTEKYRPTILDNIILDNDNKKIFNNIVKTKIFPNLLLYGPPGTGKTTTVINLINKYQESYNQIDKSLIIHLNASDDRGIDIIRNNLNTFVNSNNFFTNGTKFIILDEVDYMTKSAQTALKYLIKNKNKIDVKFCLICNYISKIDLSLQYLFCKIKFINLPYTSIFKYIDNINKQEQLNLTENHIYSLINYYKYDIRSMVNHLQCNTNININFISNDKFNNLYYNHKKPNNCNNFLKLINQLESSYCINKILITKNYIKFILETKLDDLLIINISNFEFLLHNINIQNNNYIIKNLYYILH